MQTRVLLALAAILITNSHLEEFYPSRFFAGDGHLGNAIFFFVAGLGVTLSATGRRRTFVDYYSRRIRRIYPTVFLVATVFLLVLGSGWKTWALHDYLWNYLWPTQWAFIAQVMLLYVLIFPVVRLQSPRLFLYAALLLVLPFAYCWIKYVAATPRLALGTLPESIWYIFWFQMMLLGGWFASRRQPAAGPSRMAALLPGCAALVAPYISCKFLFVTGQVTRGWFTLFILVPLIVLMLASIAQEQRVGIFLERNAWIRGPADWLGNHTLEIYTIQPFLVDKSALSRGVQFPLNIVAFWILLLLLAWLFHRAAQLISRQKRERPAITADRN